jgi:hypothetical protein
LKGREKEEKKKRKRREKEEKRKRKGREKEELRRGHPDRGELNAGRGGD